MITIYKNYLPPPPTVLPYPVTPYLTTLLKAETSDVAASTSAWRAETSSNSLTRNIAYPLACSKSTDDGTVDISILIHYPVYWISHSPQHTMNLIINSLLDIYLEILPGNVFLQILKSTCLFVNYFWYVYSLVRHLSSHRNVHVMESLNLFCLYVLYTVGRNTGFVVWGLVVQFNG